MTKIYKMVVILLGVLAIVMPSARAEEHDFRNWSVVTLQLAPTEKSRIWLEAQPRIGDNMTQIKELLLRGAVGVQVTPKVSLWQGYVWVPRFFPGETTYEHRLFQQLQINHKLQSLNITHRFRLEERFLDNLGETGVRGRYLLRVLKPITADKRWQAVLGNEYFLNLNDVRGGPQAGFDQNRLFVGINRRITKNISFETGYLNQYVNRSNGNAINHAWVAWLQWNPSPAPKKSESKKGDM